MGERPPKIGFRLVHELAADGFPVAVTCRILALSRSGYYEWRDRLPSARQTADVELTAVIQRIHYESRGTYGAPRVHAQLRLARGRRVGKKRVDSAWVLFRLRRQDGTDDCV